MKDDVIIVENNGMKYLQFKKLLEYKDKITHAYSLGIKENYRTNGDEEQREKAIKNYKKLCETIGLNGDNLIKPNQKHTNEVKVVEQVKDGMEIESQRFDETDGLITNKQDAVLATTNADCILMLFYDPVKNVIANVHSGWKGTLKTISLETINKMQEKYKCDTQDIICCMCPSIRKCHFEVKEEVKDLFYQKFKHLNEINDIIEETIPNKKWNIDTILINRVILKNYGLKEENIIDSGLCSVCNCNIMHSYRAEGPDYGLSTAIIGLAH